MFKIIGLACGNIPAKTLIVDLNAKVQLHGTGPNMTLARERDDQRSSSPLDWIVCVLIERHERRATQWKTEFARLRMRKRWREISR